MALVFHRSLAVPLWAIAFFAVALAAPPRSMPPVTLVLGIVVLALTMMAMIQWRRTSSPLLPVIGRDRAHAGIIMAVMSAGARVRGVDRATSAPRSDDALDLVRRDDDGGWQVPRQPALPFVLIPGARESGMLTTFGASAAAAALIPDEPSTMDATTIAERQREGGGAPSQRRPASERPPWNLSHTLHQFFMATRALYARRFRTNHV